MNLQNKPKLLYVTTQGHWGGAQKYIYDLAASLADEFDITVAVGEPDYAPDLQKSLKSIGIECIQLRHLRRAVSPLHDLLTIFELRKVYKQLKPDIIHLNSSKAGILGSLATYKLSRFCFRTKSRILDSAPTESGQAKKLRSYKLIYTVHGWVFNEPLPKFKKRLYKFLEKITARAKNKIIVLSETEKQAGLKLGIPENKIVIIPIGIDIRQNIMTKEQVRQALFDLLLKKPADFEKSYIIGTIANFYPTKNLDNLIEATGKLKNKLNNFHLILIGDGPELKNQKLKIKNQNLEKYIHLPGFIENASKYLPAFDIFVLPSGKEGLPYTLLEARAAGIPIIATDVGAVNTIVENKKTGLLLPPENVDKLAEAIKYAYNNQAEMKHMAQEGKKEQLPKNIADEMIKRTVELYYNSRLSRISL